MHIHARSKAEWSTVAQSTAPPRPALLNSDLEQRARTASLSALAALKRPRTDFSSALALPGYFERTGGAAAGQSSLFERSLGTRAGLSGHFERTGGAEAARTALPSTPAAAGQAGAAILSAKVAPVR